MSDKKLWWALGIVVGLSFCVLGYYGSEIYMKAPPIPGRVLTTSGKVLFTDEEIKNGQNVWQSMGGQQIGSVWGHGAYVAPDWSADWLHRESEWLLEYWAKLEGANSFSSLSEDRRAVLKNKLQKELRTNTFKEETKDLVISEDRALAIEAVSKHYTGLFGSEPSLQQLREAYAIPQNTLKDEKRKFDLNAFFFWTSWACTTNRPGTNVTYTNNWPHEKLVGNEPTPPIVVWSVVSFILLLAGIAALAWHYALKKQEESGSKLPDWDPLLALKPTPSMQATLKYFWVVCALIVGQVILGAVTAHYGVEGTGFYGIPLAKWIPYAVTRTWHTQLGIFWIATAWLATGLFVAPAVSGYEPKFQRLGVNFLFVCLILIVAGSMVGQWFAVQQRLGFEMNFWFGHQGYEYVDLGRFWQIFLLIGLFLWLFLTVRALMPAVKKSDSQKSILTLFLIASAAIAMFYAAGLMWGRQTNLAVAEYWRWWVVHLWVEGFFEVFAAVVIAFLFTRMGLLGIRTATTGVLFSTVIFLSGGIIGTFHHLYFSGTPTAILALGSTFSALEVVPLVLMGFEAYENLTLTKAKPWVKAYQWPIYFFVAVAFWNLVGAGLFGFLINPPIALYYMQGLNTTPVHGHTALFGVYGMLGIGLMLFCLKGLAARTVWKTGVIRFAFWSINIGLALMVLLSLLPVGLLQTWASVEHGMWYARSADFLQTEPMSFLRWLRVPGDTLFAVGILALGWFVLGLKTGWSLESEQEPSLKEIEENQFEPALD